MSTTVKTSVDTPINVVDLGTHVILRQYGGEQSVKFNKTDASALIAAEAQGAGVTIEQIADAMGVTLPQAHEWIPTSERLPSEKPWNIDSAPTDSVWDGGRVCTYLVTIKPHDLADAYTAEISWANGGWHYDPDANDNALTCVIAWRHMPEPYRGGSE